MQMSRENDRKIEYLVRVMGSVYDKQLYEIQNSIQNSFIKKPICNVL